MTRIILIIVLMSAAFAPMGAAHGQTAIENRITQIQSRLDQLEHNIDVLLRDEAGAQIPYRNLMTTQLSIIRTEIDKIFPDKYFGRQLQEVQQRAESNLAFVASHPNPNIRATAPTYQAQIEAVVNIRTSALEQSTQGLQAIRELQDESELMVMLIKANAMDAAIDNARQRLELLRELANMAVALAERMESLTNVPSD